MTEPLDLDALSALAEASIPAQLAMDGGPLTADRRTLNRAMVRFLDACDPREMVALIARIKRFEAAIRVERIEAILHDYEEDIVADAQSDGRLNCATFAAVLHDALAAR